MSIIFDALSKIQKNRQQHNEVSYAVSKEIAIIEKNKSSLIQRVRITTSRAELNTLILISLTMVLLMMHYSSIIMYYTNWLIPPSKATTLIPLHYQKLSLSGVFISDQFKMAMINNQSYKLGDKIDGMEIVDIQMDSVLLKNLTRTLELKQSVV